MACAAAALPLLHRDPFDRVIVALAQAQGLTVLTSDENIGKYPGVTTVGERMTRSPCESAVDQSD
jgi:PIN domain nuclease of toxin-antitoxin system